MTLTCFYNIRLLNFRNLNIISRGYKVHITSLCVCSMDCNVRIPLATEIRPAGHRESPPQYPSIEEVLLWKLLTFSSHIFSTKIYWGKIYFKVGTNYCCQETIVAILKVLHGSYYDENNEVYSHDYYFKSICFGCWRIPIYSISQTLPSNFTLVSKLLG